MKNNFLIKTFVVLFALFVPAVVYAADSTGALLLFGTLGLILPVLFFGSLVASKHKKIILIVHAINAGIFSYYYLSQYSDKDFSTAFVFIAYYSFISMMIILAFSIILRIATSIKTNEENAG